MLIQEPFTIGRLPKPVISKPEKPLFGQVYGLQGSRKRKRFEISAAINGEAILTYNIQSAKLISSYAVPPQARFTCSPCSVRIRPKAGGSIRRTFCAFKRSEQEIHSYYDSSAEPIPSSQKIELRNTTSPIVYLETIPCLTQTESGGEDVDVVAVHEDGSLEGFSGDLRTERFRTSINKFVEGQGRPLTVKTASLLSFEDARKTIFRGRDDLIAQLAGSASDAHVKFSILILINTPQAESEGTSSSFRIRIFAIPHSTPATTGLLHQSGIVDLVNTDLPQSERVHDSTNLQVDLHSAPGTLLIRDGSALTAYDSLAFAPRLISQIDLSTAESSIQYLNPHLLAESSASGLTIFDTKYRTAQAQLDMSRILQNLGRKMTSVEGDLSVQLLSYFPKIGFLLALIGQSLVSFELSRPSKSRRALKGQGISLLDAIDQGTPQASTRIKHSQPKKLAGFGQAYVCNGLAEDETWISDRPRMDAFVKDDNIVAFEETLASHLCKDQANVSDLKEIEGLKLPSKIGLVDNSKVDFLISSIFDTGDFKSAHESDETDLRIKFLPPRLVQWLICSNCFTSAYLERRILGVGKRQPTRACVARAIVQCDTSLQWLCVYLQDSPTVDLLDLICILELLVADAVAAFQNPSTPSKMLTNGKSAVQTETLGDKMNIDDESKYDESSIRLNQQYEVSKFEEVKAGAETTAMRLALKKLEKSENESIVSTMEAMLPQEKMIGLIQFLRHELFTAGYTSHFRHHDVDSLAYQQPIALATIVQMMACCINALGPISFIDSGDNENFFEKLISDLRGEISAALAGVEEAMYVQGLLREMLRFGTSAVKHNVPKYPSLAASSRSSQLESQKPGTIVTIYSEPSDQQGDPSASTGMLPLSLQADELVSDMKTRKGGGQVSRRSVREKAYLRQQREVGKYSFDRLVL